MRINTVAFLIGLLAAIPVLAAPQRKMTHSPPLRLSGLVTVNRHLHLGSPGAKEAKGTKADKGDKADKKGGKADKDAARRDDRRDRAAVYVHRYWHRRWNFATWAVLHRHLGTVNGIVRDASGQGVAGVRLALRKPRGGIFASLAMKHVVHSGPGGHFVMAGVRAGRYRIMAFVGKKGTHAQIVVHSGAAIGVTLGV
ncbi:MAG TPA: carboxypeptidase-like regulatory domain-containing protein [Tepidisphaeraceae bacterium]|nr:carboxypeptidase-like regulatory domain-containing protein [Tepidisphaeraceae bacterium]